MKKGDFFETLVKFIHESLKNDHEVQIIPKAKLLNAHGRKREFDLLIISKITGYEIYVAIECRDTNRKVSVNQMEAFIKKCERIPIISKKIFVSKFGFQKDAINAAKDYDVVLYQLEDLSREQIKNWITGLGIKQMNFQGYARGIQFILKEPRETPYEGELILGNDNITGTFKADDFILFILKLNAPNFYKNAMEYYVKLLNRPIKENIAEVSLNVSQNLEGSGVHILYPDKKHYVSEIKATMCYAITEKEAVPDHAKSYNDLSTLENKAQVASYTNLLPNSRLTVVKTRENEKKTNMFLSALDGGPINVENIPFVIGPDGLVKPETDTQ